MKRILPLLLLGAAAASGGCAILTAAADGDVLKVASAVAETRNKSAAAVDRITADDERAVGQAAALSIIQQRGGLVLEEDLNRYVNDVANLVGLQGERFEKGSNGVARLQSRRFFVGILDDQEPNAFALPGGYILLTRGLLERLASEAELAFVLGHEIAHIDGEHGLNALKAQVRAGTIITDGATDFKNSRFFARVTDGFVGWFMKHGWDAEAESVADRYGLRYAMKAGYHPESARLVMRLLDVEARASGAPTVSSKTHASPADRFKAMEKEFTIKADAPGAWMTERYDRRCVQRLEAFATVASKGTP